MHDYHATDIHSSARLPMFIDRAAGTHCAVAHLIATTGGSGGHALADAVDRVAHLWTITEMVNQYEARSEDNTMIPTTPTLHQLGALDSLVQ